MTGQANDLLFVTVKKSTTSPLALFSLYSPKGTYDALYLTSYAMININDPMSRVPGIGQVSIFGAGQYAMRFWVHPDTLSKLGMTVSEILDALQKQNTVNPAGQIGAEPVPPRQEFTCTVRAQGRLTTDQEFGDVVVRANVDGSLVRMRDVARIELGSQTYSMSGRLNGAPSAIIAVYQLPGSNQAWPGSFGQGSADSFTHVDAIYFSFVTIATLGYGDIVLTSDPARGLAMVEAVGGQMHLAVLVARLVSLYGKERG